MTYAKNALFAGAQAHATFQVFSDGRGHWCARKSDDMIAGTFFNRAAALRFARDESSAGPAASRDDGTTLMPPIAPPPVKARRVVLFLQLAFVGFLLVGRVAAGMIDASVTPGFGSAVAADLPVASAGR